MLQTIQYFFFSFRLMTVLLHSQYWGYPDQTETMVRNTYICVFSVLKPICRLWTFYIWLVVCWFQQWVLWWNTAMLVGRDRSIRYDQWAFSGNEPGKIWQWKPFHPWHANGNVILATVYKYHLDCDKTRTSLPVQKVTDPLHANFIV